MEKNRSSKIIAIIALVVAVVGLTVGFSALSSVLVIKSGASFKLNGETFDVVFSSSSSDVELNSINPTITGEGVHASAATIDNSGLNPTIKGLNVKFTAPGQKAVYKFYAANTGGVDAYLNSITYKNVADDSQPKKCTGSLGADNGQVQQACNGIKIQVKTGNVSTYGSNASITDSAIPSKTNKEIEVTIEYDIEATKPNGDFSIEFGDIEMAYGETQLGA